MIVSWNWLTDYVALDMDRAELEHRLSMSGLNHEGTQSVGDDVAIDLEVTSNRPDCLGHIGVAREIAVLFGRELTVPSPAPKEGSADVADLAKVRIDCEDLCFRYTARIVRGVKIGPSPSWLAGRLEAIGVAAINNVVDISNYVLMECGQPLHTFDFGGLAGGEIVVRRAEPGEQFLAIDHRTYELDPAMCVIADARRAVALGGVMGGADTEISGRTTDVLIEAAEFEPISIRTTARKLNLHSPSSYRFERRVDPHGIDWAGRRCAELILDIAGGELARGVIDVGPKPPERKPIVLRLSQIERILGIRIPADEIRRIFSALGCREKRATAATIETVPPTWRRDLSREIDLVEEAARIYGYDKIPEDVSVPMAPSHRDDADRVLAKIRTVLTAAGFDEAMTASAVSRDDSAAFSPWSDADPIRCSTPMLRGADRLRRSLVPSLLGARRTNESLGNSVIELFETANVYLPQPGHTPGEETMLALASGGDFYYVKGVVEAIVGRLDPAASLETADCRGVGLLAGDRSCRLLSEGRTCGYMGEVSPDGLKRFGLRGPTTVAELRVAALEKLARLVPTYREQSAYPAIVRDVNLIVDETVRWADLAATVRTSGGKQVESLRYRETFRDPGKDGAGKKRLLFSFTLRSPERTLTGEEAEQVFQNILAACRKRHAATLLG